MCGVTGIYFYKKDKNTDDLTITINRMTNSLMHRGPDDKGVWIDSDCRLALGHTRLSVLDLSDRGKQPMTSASKRYVITYNGEIYNVPILKRDLEQKGHKFKGNSDTEVLLAAIEEWGLVDAINKSNGMFAFALWDRKLKMLYLVRDRMGEKPLYFGLNKGRFIFSSELKAFHEIEDIALEIDRNALALFIRNNYIESPWSIYKDIFKLPPGHIASFPLEKISSWSIDDFFDNITPYWSAKDISKALLAINETEALDLLDNALGQAVEDRMISDVPLGAFLSGGIDSSLVVSYMAKKSKSAVKTFSIGYNENEFDEAKHAKNIARHLGTDHTELYLTPEKAMSVIDKLPRIYDEPFSDASQIPTWFVNDLARKDVTVALSGDGGDELFFGYERYFEVLKLRKHLFTIPVTLRKPIGWGLGHLFTTQKNQYRKTADRIGKISAMLSIDSEKDLYKWLLYNWKNPEDIVTNSMVPERFFSCYDIDELDISYEEWMMLYDLISYLPEDNLVKNDRASMDHALEVRAPFLDHNFVELSSQIPFDLKFKNKEKKYLLKTLLKRHIPTELFDRPKQGFHVPIASWLRGPLREWAEELLNEKRLYDEGYINPKHVRQKWTEHLSGKHDWSPRLWNVLMFQSWLQYWHSGNR